MTRGRGERAAAGARPIRALIADDEPLARERIRTLLEAEPDVVVIGECTDGASSVDAIRAQKPDLVFLDVQMPGLDGFDVIEAVGLEAFPAVVFVTAFDRYALKAFDVHALDYLLKPFDRARFHRTLERARVQLERQAGEDHRLLALMEQVRAAPGRAGRILVRGSGRVSFVRTDEIDYVLADGNYVRIHAGPERHLLRETLAALEEKLDPQRFLRIHRSTIVNVDRVKELQPLFHGDYVVVLRSGTRLTLSRTYRDRVQRALGQSL